MKHNALDEWILSLLPTHGQRQIAAITHVGRDRIWAVRGAHRSQTKLLHQLGPPRKNGKTQVPPGYATTLSVPVE